MSTQEDRMTALEQRVTAMELERLYERKRATESASSEQAYDVKQVNYHLTMLLGIATGQEHAITSIKNDVNSIRGQVTDMSAQVTDLRLQVTDVRGQIADVRQDMSEMRGQIADVRQDMREQIADVKQDVSRQITDVKQDVSNLNFKFDRLEKLITDHFLPS